jgi:hypothetical protein
MPAKTTATKSVVYSGGLDSVVMHFPSAHVVEFPRGTSVEVCGEDAEVLADHPDFQPAPKATTPTTKSPEEDA